MRFLIYLVVIASLTACKTIERQDENARPISAIEAYTGEIPNMLRGTIKQHVGVMGYHMGVPTRLAGPE